MTDVYEAFQNLITDGSLSIVEQVVIPSREVRRAPLPTPFKQGPLAAWLKDRSGGDFMLWNHQSEALTQLDLGSNVVVATGTASGKSLVFQVAAFHELMTGGGTTIVLYPLKALLSDQAHRWRTMARELSLADDCIAEIHGQIHADTRMDAVKSAKIILATPDAIHAWLMRQVSLPAIRNLLASLRFLVLDEAHSYDSVFGSNVAYLIRRFLAARRRICKDQNINRPLQIVAATATILDPADHLLSLTGWPFVAIDESADGSPAFGRVLLHIEGPSSGSGRVWSVLRTQLTTIT
jgi:DEAD/DEAH box helicase domain-containing protein